MRFVSLSVLTIFCAGASTAWSAPERTVYQCARGDLTRVIEVASDADATPVCEVWYDKPQETTTRQRLWSADHDVNFCAEKAQAFVEKMTGWGWTCQAAGAAAAPAGEGMAPAEQPMDEPAAEDEPQDPQ